MQDIAQTTKKTPENLGVSGDRQNGLAMEETYPLIAETVKLKIVLPPQMVGELEALKKQKCFTSLNSLIHRAIEYYLISAVIVICVCWI